MVAKAIAGQALLLETYTRSSRSAGGFVVPIPNETKSLCLIILYYVGGNLGNASGG